MHRTAISKFRLSNHRQIISFTFLSIFSLYLLEGCTIIGYSHGKQIDRAYSTKVAIEMKDDIRICETGDRVEITVKEGRVFRGKILEINRGRFIELRSELANGLIDKESENIEVEWTSIASISVLESSAKWTFLLTAMGVLADLAIPAALLVIGFALGASAVDPGMGA